MKKIESLLMKVSTLAAGVIMLPSRVYAQGWQPTTGYGGTLTQLIKDGLNTAIILAAVVAVGFLVINGIKYMTSAGDTGKTEEAQKGIASALIGLVICIAAAVIVNFVLARLNITPQELE